MDNYISQRLKIVFRYNICCKKINWYIVAISWLQKILYIPLILKIVNKTHKEAQVALILLLLPLRGISFLEL